MTRKRTAQVKSAMENKLELAEIGELQKTQEFWRLLGDPRLRVQVSTESDVEQPQPTPASQRYVTG